MLRVTKRQELDGVVVLLPEGRLVTKSLDVLDWECRNVMARHRQVRVDLAAVAHADGNGVWLLRQMMRCGVVIANATPVLALLLGDRRSSTVEIGRT